MLRTEYPQVPPKVEYSLTDRGQSLVEVMRAHVHLGQEHRDDTCCQMPEMEEEAEKK